jgi:hypothetical protein
MIFVKKAASLLCVLSSAIVFATFLLSSFAFAAENPYEPFIGLWKAVSYEESRPDGKTGSDLNYDARWITWRDAQKKDSLDMFGFSKYENTYEGHEEDYSASVFQDLGIKFGPGSEGKIIYSGTGSYVDGKEINAKYETRYEIIDGRLVLSFTLGDVYADKTVFERVAPDEIAGHTNPFVGGWRAVSGTSDVGSLKNGRMIITTLPFGQKQENMVDAGFFGRAYFEKGQYWLNQRYFNEKKFIKFDADSPKTVRWTEEEDFTNNGIKETLRTIYQLDINKDGTLALSVKNKYSGGKAVFKKEF